VLEVALVKSQPSLSHTLGVAVTLAITKIVRNFSNGVHTPMCVLSRAIIFSNDYVSFVVHWFKWIMLFKGIASLS